ncbi:hypothetical protein EXIGLDRAFT_829353 [Exidia glandulosa HHB12029]|uniref:DUF6535 domain-containing protein n=1 Tax=Exidia glandulosa HHB12029 TaxID=1314781 RepID=A0A165PPG0_EXIGL|nr:hypothetical protein EXIGLDRAFT_829353 [Exidia glandulosa HHB12029]
MDYTGSPPQTQRPQGLQHGPYIASYPPEELKTEFQRKYPPDPFGKEMEASARVWKVFKDEATNHDKTLLAGWNKTLDILLIFAGLFSAVATAFVIESYKLLQPDYEEYIATALFVAFSARNASDASGALLESTLDLRNPADFAPLRSSRWLNGMWFTSLVLSLLVAFLCILLKQWLEEYNGRISAPFPSVRQWARRRTFYFDGVTDWAVPVFIAILPLLLHAALFLFLAGLGLLLLPLDSVNAVWLVTLTGCLAIFYVVSTVLPFMRPDCPSTTPLIRLLRMPLRILGLRILMWISFLAVSPNVEGPVPDDRAGNEPLSPMQRYFLRNVASVVAFSRRASSIGISAIGLLVPPRLRSRMMETYWRLHYQFAATSSSVTDPSLRGREFSDIEQEQLEARALQWLVTSRSTAEVVVVGFQAIGALPPWSPVAATLRQIDDLTGLFSRSLRALYRLGTDTDTCSPADISRSLRSAKCLLMPSMASIMVGAAACDQFDKALAGIPHYDWPFLRDAEIVTVLIEMAPSRLSPSFPALYCAASAAQ